jgi:poly(3-hydroxybutyrate) depolymerase
MSVRIPILSLSAFVLSGTLNAAPVRYKEPVFTAVATASNIQYGSAITYAGAAQNLLLDVYQPAGDTAKARPLFVFVHGGGFSGGAKTDGDIVYLCQTFAKKGYVTASFEYRLQSPLSDKQTMGAEVLRAVQDAKAAVRYMRAHRADYRIDDSRIMMGGTSAGGVLSLEYAYFDADEVPDYIDTNAIGGVEGRSGTPGVSSAINGIMNCWGGVGDSTWLYDGRLPVISFHGTADQTVPYDIGYSLGNPDLVTFGSACVHRVLTRAGVRSVLKPFPGMGHGVPGGDPRVDTLVSMAADFAYDVLFGSATSIAFRPKPERVRIAAPEPAPVILMRQGSSAGPVLIGRNGFWSLSGRALPAFP